MEALLREIDDLRRRLEIIETWPRPFYEIGARVYHNANQSISHASLTALAFNNERFDSGGFHDTATNNSRLTVPTGLDGKYLIFGSVRWATSATGYRELSIRLNGTILIAVDARGAAPTYGTYVTISGIYDLSAGDYAELIVYQESGGGALNVESASAYSPEFGLWRLS
jgi:hypothetical protein